MDAQLACATCGATFHQYSLEQKYCSATCRNKARYANQKHQLAKVEQLFSIAEELARSQERLKQLEAQLKDQKEENAALRATIQQLAAQPTPSHYHIKTVTTDSIHLSSYDSNGALLSEQEI